MTSKAAEGIDEALTCGPEKMLTLVTDIFSDN